MTCRYDSDDPRKCDRCGALLWALEEGWACVDCGVTMPCTMRIAPPPAIRGPGPTSLRSDATG